MVKSTSLFSQLLGEIPRDAFNKLVDKHKAERNAKGFTCWSQFVAMLFCQLAHADSLRETCNGLACCAGKLNHFGVSGPPSKSNLSYANAQRPAALYEEMFMVMAALFRKEGKLDLRGKNFNFKHKLLSLDSTTISLCLELFPWAKFRRAKGGVKAHVLLDHDDYMPRFVHITPAKTHDKKVFPLLDIKPGSIVAMDRAYTDYAQFARWTQEGVYFVTRMKENAAYHVTAERTPPQNRNIISDETVEFANDGSWEKCPHPLRRVVVWDEKNERELVLLTNHTGFGASTIAAIYKDRWQIELFFKMLKQNLKIKSFVGTSENALRIQIWTALIALLLLKWLHHLSQARWSFSNLACLLRLNLFTHRNLHQWLDNPYNTPPEEEYPEQLLLDFPGFGQPAQNIQNTRRGV
jgi:hypothetical protein